MQESELEAESTDAKPLRVDDSLVSRRVSPRERESAMGVLETDEVTGTSLAAKPRAGIPASTSRAEWGA